MATDVDKLIFSMNKELIFNNHQLNAFKQFIDEQEYDTNSIIRCDI